MWVNQGDCHIFKYGNLLLGFCQREVVDVCGIVTFVFQDRTGVDEMYKKLRSLAEHPPHDNPEYRIYHFFAKDPDGRLIEIQCFWDDPEKQVGKL